MADVVPVPGVGAAGAGRAVLAAGCRSGAASWRTARSQPRSGNVRIDPPLVVGGHPELERGPRDPQLERDRGGTALGGQEALVAPARSRSAGPVAEHRLLMMLAPKSLLPVEQSHRDLDAATRLAGQGRDSHSCERQRECGRPTALSQTLTQSRGELRNVDISKRTTASPLEKSTS